MPRIAKLNWELSRNKWKVVYKDRKYRFDGGAGKSDREAKKAAEVAWRQIKLEVDTEKIESRPLHREYQSAIAQWQGVQTWAIENNNEDLAVMARDAIADLSSRLKRSRLEPLDELDWFLPTRPLSELSDHEVLEECVVPINENASIEEQIEIAIKRRRDADMRWRDRLETQKKRRSQVQSGDTLRENVELFLEGKRKEVRSNGLSVGRVEVLKRNLAVFTEFASEDMNVGEIDHKTHFRFRDFLLERIATDRYAPTYARDILASFKQFVRWLVSTTDRLDHLPKNIDDKQLTIVARTKRAKTLEIDVTQKILKAATERTRLYLLLGLNCAMTQVDISDIHPSEVNWTDQTITRKRSKTGNIDSVPEVTYKLWPETFALLSKYRSTSSEHVLVTKAGGPLCISLLKEDDEISKTDAVRLAVRYLAKKTNLQFSMKSFKKTSASLLRNNPTYNGIESLFLGHAPRSMSDRHYTSTPQDLFDEAISWLRDELGIAAAFKGAD